MNLRKVRGRDLNQALHRAREGYGEHALVWAQRRVHSGEIELEIIPRPEGSERDALAPLPTHTPGELELARRLEQSGVSRRFVRHILAERPGDEHPLDGAAIAIAATFPRLRSIVHDNQTKIVALIGAYGVGKTSVAASLCSRLLGAGRRVGLTCLGEPEEGREARLHEWMRAKGATNILLTEPARLAPSLRSERAPEVLLMDSPGRDHRTLDTLRSMARVAASIEFPAVFEPYLVLPADMPRADLERCIQDFAVLEPRAAVVTRLDLTERPGVVLECLWEAGLTPVWLHAGKDPLRSGMRADSANLSDLLLSGRLRTAPKP